MRDRQHVVRLLGETIREMGLLAFVFAPLDATFGDGELNLIAIAVAMVTGTILIGCGIMAET